MRLTHARRPDPRWLCWTCLSWTWLWLASPGLPAQILTGPSRSWNDPEDGSVGAWVRKDTLHVQARNSPTFPRAKSFPLGIAGTRLLVRFDQGKAQATYLCIGEDPKGKRAFALALSHTRYEARAVRPLWFSRGLRLQFAAYDEDSRCLVLQPKDQDALLWWRAPAGFAGRAPLTLGRLPLKREGYRFVGTLRAPERRHRNLLPLDSPGRDPNYLELPASSPSQPGLQLLLHPDRGPEPRLLAPRRGWIHFAHKTRPEPDRVLAIGPPGVPLLLYSHWTGAVLGSGRCDERGRALITHAAVPPGEVLRLRELKGERRSRGSRVHSRVHPGPSPSSALLLRREIARLLRAGDLLQPRLLVRPRHLRAEALALLAAPATALQRLGPKRYRIRPELAWCVATGKGQSLPFRLPIPAAASYWHRSILLQTCARIEGRWEFGRVHEVAVLPPDSQAGRISPKALSGGSLSSELFERWMRDCSALPYEIWRRSIKAR